MKNFSKYWLLLFLAVLLISSAKAQNSNSTDKTTVTPIVKALEQPVASSANKINPLLIGATIPEVKLKSIEGIETIIRNKPSVGAKIILDHLF